MAQARPQLGWEPVREREGGPSTRSESKADTDTRTQTCSQSNSEFGGWTVLVAKLTGLSQSIYASVTEKLPLICSFLLFSLSFHSFIH